ALLGIEPFHGSDKTLCHCFFNSFDAKKKFDAVIVPWECQVPKTAHGLPRAVVHLHPTRPTSNLLQII
ncbi:MAG TPA: hypothetical protein VF355_05485, partial [Anaerolineaceae bacterium]